jgi:hypothetical protein
MPSLHIEHPITDLPTWLAAFEALADARRAAGVLAEQVRHPAADEAQIVVDLEFATIAEARNFLDFLRTVVWAAPERSPALAGTPRAVVLDDVARG